MLVSATKTGTSVSFKYDPWMRRGQKTVGSAVTRTYYSGQRRIADYNGATWQQRYIYGAGLDEILLTVGASGTKTYYNHDHQGAVIAKTNSSGVVANNYSYSAFGESALLTASGPGYTGVV